MTEEVHFARNSGDRDRAEIIRVLEVMLGFGNPESGESALRVAVRHPFRAETGHGGAGRRNRVDDIAGLRSLVDVLMRTLGAQSMIIRGHHRKTGGDHGHQSLIAVVHVLHGGRCAQPRDTAGAMRPRNDGPALRRRRPRGDQHRCGGCDITAGCIERMVDDAHRGGAFRQGVAGERFLAQQISRLGGSQIGRGRVKISDGEAVGLFYGGGFGHRLGHLLRECRGRAGRQRQCNQ